MAAVFAILVAFGNGFALIVKFLTARERDFPREALGGTHFAIRFRRQSHDIVFMTVTALPSRHHVNRALTPVAGRGTRMYPATAAVPKELLPIGNRPLLEFTLATRRAPSATSTALAPADDCA